MGRSRRWAIGTIINRMDVAEALWHLGGVAAYNHLAAVTSPAAVRGAVHEARIIRVGRGTYALPGTATHIAAARGLNGALSHTSAAQYWGIATWEPPAAAWITVPRNRRVTSSMRRGRVIIRQDVAIDGIATTPLQTVLDCARRLPFAESLAIADSALSRGLVGAEELRSAAAALARPGHAIAVAEHADPRAETPFESTIRAHALPVTDLDLVPQAQIAGYGRADLADIARGLIVECDSFTFHAGRPALLNDIERYNRAALLQARLVRFGYEHAHQPEYVRRVLSECASLPQHEHTVLRIES